MAADGVIEGYLGVSSQQKWLEVHGLYTVGGR
jgi:hypothetical protein